MDLMFKVIGGVAHGEKFTPERGTRRFVAHVAPAVQLLEGKSREENLTATQKLEYQQYYLYDVRAGRTYIGVWLPYDVWEQYAHEYILACALEGYQNVNPNDYGSGHP